MPNHMSHLLHSGFTKVQPKYEATLKVLKKM